MADNNFKYSYPIGNIDKKENETDVYRSFEYLKGDL